MASSLSPNFPKTTIYMALPNSCHVPHQVLFPLDENHPYFHWRNAEDEDDNISAAKEMKCQNRRNKIQHFAKRYLSFTNLDPGQPANLTAPQARPLRWMISSYHTPDEYQAERVRGHSSWYLLLQCMLIDLPKQLKSGIGTWWRDCQVQEKGEIKFLDSYALLFHLSAVKVETACCLFRTNQRRDSMAHRTLAYQVIS
jgi:hypothetical protein